MIESDWYQGYWSDVYQLSSDQNVKGHYKNDRNGKRFAGSSRGGVYGHGADFIIADDLMDPLQANSEQERVNAQKHYFQTLYTRLNDQETGLRINVQQRLHEDDVSGVIMKKYSDDYQSIVIPIEPDQDVLQPKGLIKFYKENSFFPERFGVEFQDDAKKFMGMEYPTQYGQRPAKQDGNIIKPQWFMHYSRLPAKIDFWFQSWDMSFKAKPKTKKGKVDYVVGQVWAKSGANCYLVDQVRRKMGMVETIDAVKAMKAKYPQSRTIYIEDKANGPGVIDSLRNIIPGIVESEPCGDKVSRCNAVLYVIKSGNVYLPLVENAQWVQGFLDECAAFDNGTHDDQVDAMTQALKEVFGSYVSKLKKLLAA